MGRFTNSKYTQVVNSLTSAIESKINNPYYKFSDKKPTTVIYYKQNREKSKLDPDSGTAYQHVGEHSPFKYNKINNFLLYGMGRIELNYEVGDYGLESGEITGDAVILPNTIIPTQGDFFYVPYINEDVLFKVNSITPDTLDNGSNFYRIEYKLELINCREQIEKQVVETYEFIAANIGTDFQCILKSGNYDLVNQLEESELKNNLQDRLNAIVPNLSLTSQSVTSNLDIYIKSENMLSLSLDTNSVTFEDFSGVEDLEKQNAVTLTVNSSLPYEINSYLVSEMKNANNSETMDKSILNIKANSGSEYGSFTDLVTPIKLFDNQVAGNNKVHGIDLKLKGNIAHKADVYKTTIKFEVNQK